MSLMGELINFIVKAIESISNFSDFFGLIIIFIALWSFYICHNKLLKERKHLKKFIKNKDKLTGSNKEKITYIDDNNLLDKSNHIKILWNRYKLDLGKKSIDNKVLDIGSYFNKKTIIEALGKRQLAQIIPGTLTALGILGTFLGLQDGVSNLETGNTEMLQDSISSLTQGMSLAFITSIVGILSSSLWLFFDRSLYKSYVDTILEFRTAFEEKFEYFYIESFLNEMLLIERESRDSVKSMATDISLEFAKALDTSIGTMSNSLEEFTNKTSQNQVMAFEGVTSGFTNDLNELKTTLQDLTSWHKEVKDGLSEVVEEIKESSTNYKDINTNLESTVDKYTSMLDKLSGMNKETNNNMVLALRITDDLKDVALSNSSAVIDMNSLHELNREYLDKSEESFKGINNDLVEIRESIKLMSSELDESTMNFSESLKDGLDTTFNIFDNNLSEISKRLSGTILEINESVDEIPDIIRYLHSEIQSHTIDLKEAMKTATELYGQVSVAKDEARQ